MPAVSVGVLSWPCVLAGKRRQGGIPRQEPSFIIHTLIKGSFERSPLCPLAGTVEMPVLLLYSLLVWAGIKTAVGVLFQES